MAKQKQKVQAQGVAEKAEATHEQMAAKASEIKAIYKKAVEGVVEAGKVLRGFEEQVVAGCFKQFITTHLEWSRTQVYRVMWVYDRFGQCPNLGRFDLSALYALSAPRCPQQATAEALTLAEEGKYVTHQMAQKLVAKHAPAAAPVVARTRSILVNKADLKKAAKARKIDLDKLVATLQDVHISLRWEEDAQKTGEAA